MMLPSAGKTMPIIALQMTMKLVLMIITVMVSGHRTGFAMTLMPPRDPFRKVHYASTE